MQTVKRKPIAKKLFDDSFIMNKKSEIKKKQKSIDEMREEIEF